MSLAMQGTKGRRQGCARELATLEVEMALIRATHPGSTAEEQADRLRVFHRLAVRRHAVLSLMHVLAAVADG